MHFGDTAHPYKDICTVDFISFFFKLWLLFHWGHCYYNSNARWVFAGKASYILTGAFTSTQNSEDLPSWAMINFDVFTCQNRWSFSLFDDTWSQQRHSVSCITILFSMPANHQIKHQAKWAVNLVIADGHLISSVGCDKMGGSSTFSLQYHYINGSNLTDRTTHPKSNLTGVQTIETHDQTVHFMSVECSS